MNRNKVRSVLDWLNEYTRQNISDIKMEYAIENAIRDLMDALRKPDVDPGDECECEGCKTTEPAPHKIDGLFVRVDDNGNTSISTVDDYEIRLKAWNIAYDFEWEDLNNEFSATLDAATKLYNFLSGQNEDTK